jgi:hypothetical protein
MCLASREIVHDRHAVQRMIVGLVETTLDATTEHYENQTGEHQSISNTVHPSLSFPTKQARHLANCPDHTCQHSLQVTVIRPTKFS